TLIHAVSSESKPLDEKMHGLLLDVIARRYDLEESDMKEELEKIRLLDWDKTKSNETEAGKGVLFFSSAFLKKLRGHSWWGKLAASGLENFVAPYAEEIIFTAAVLAFHGGITGLIISRFIFTLLHMTGPPHATNKKLNLILKLTVPLLISVL